MTYIHKITEPTPSHPSPKGLDRQPTYQKVPKGNYWPRFKELCWVSTPFLFLNPIFALIGVPLALWLEGFSWTMLLFAFIFGNLAHLGITMGYHRLFSHRAYEAHPVLRYLLLFLGTASIQNSVLKWCNDHRKHHAKIDHDDDPYCIGKGFWFAHLGWMLKRLPPDYAYRVPDLQKDPVLVWQHNWYVPLAVAVGYVFPFLVGLALGYPLWGLFVGGFARVSIGQHTTFFVNSLAHWMGKHTYSDEISARDSWTVAFLTHGEGFHNFHHQFQFDYRNGVAAHHWDPTKWVIYLCSKLGLASKLKRVEAAEILKARLTMDQKRIAETAAKKGYAQEYREKIEHKLAEIREQMVSAQLRLKKLKTDYEAAKTAIASYPLRERATESFKKYCPENPRVRLQQIKQEIEQTKAEVRLAMKSWRMHIESV